MSHHNAVMQRGVIPPRLLVMMALFIRMLQGSLEDALPDIGPRYRQMPQGR